MVFILLPQFEKFLHICDLKLSKVLLNRAKEYPWIFLIPMRENIAQINQLNGDDQMQLMKEINLVSNTMEKLFQCDRLNVAAIGNKTTQLHIHIICRMKNDPHWPETVWQYSCDNMSDEEYCQRSRLIQKSLLPS